MTTTTTTTTTTTDDRTATLPRLRKALLEKYGTDRSGEANITMYRSPSGYYYFSGVLGILAVPSIYSYRITDWTVQQVLDHVAEAVGYYR